MLVVHVVILLLAGLINFDDVEAVRISRQIRKQHQSTISNERKIQIPLKKVTSVNALFRKIPKGARLKTADKSAKHSLPSNTLRARAGSEPGKDLTRSRTLPNIIENNINSAVADKHLKTQKKSMGTVLEARIPIIRKIPKVARKEVEPLAQNSKPLINSENQLLAKSTMGTIVRSNINTAVSEKHLESLTNSMKTVLLTKIPKASILKEDVALKKFDPNVRVNVLNRKIFRKIPKVAQKVDNLAENHNDGGNLVGSSGNKTIAALVGKELKATISEKHLESVAKSMRTVLRSRIQKGGIRNGAHKSLASDKTVKVVHSPKHNAGFESATIDDINIEHKPQDVKFSNFRHIVESHDTKNSNSRQYFQFENGSFKKVVLLDTEDLRLDHVKSGIRKGVNDVDASSEDKAFVRVPKVKSNLGLTTTERIDNVEHVALAVKSDSEITKSSDTTSPNVLKGLKFEGDSTSKIVFLDTEDLKSKGLDVEHASISLGSSNQAPHQVDGLETNLFKFNSVLETNPLDAEGRNQVPTSSSLHATSTLNIPGSFPHKSAGGNHETLDELEFKNPVASSPPISLKPTSMSDIDRVGINAYSPGDLDEAKIIRPRKKGDVARQPSSFFNKFG